MVLDYETGKPEQWSVTAYTCPNCLSGHICDAFNYCPMCWIKIDWVEPDLEEMNILSAGKGLTL
jgi:hypothetical protein